MKKSLIGSGLAAAVLLAGCATPPPASTGAPAAPGAPASDFTACMVSDSGGFDDKSFNQTSHKGLLDAVSQLNIKKNEAQSKTTSDFAGNIQQMVDAKCDIVVTVGFLLGDATKAAAEANPNVKFAIVDFAYTDETTGANIAPANLKGLVFNTGEPAFLAGYTAASLSQSGKVGTFGGMKIPSVTAFMEGYAQGVKYYNEKKGKDVQVLGWDSAAQDGQFIPGASPFEDIAGGKRVAQTLADQGADVIMPVAGPAGEGGLQVAQASGGKIAGIWVDTDGFVSMPNYKEVVATSVGKAMDVAVLEAIKAAKDDTFNNEIYVGTLKNEGAYLAPFHDFDAKVSAETKAELKQIEEDIVSGKLVIKA